MKLISKNKHAVIRICKLILNVNTDVTEDHVLQLKTIFQDHLNSGMSPNDIKNYYKIAYSDFGMFLKKSLHLQIRSCKEAVNNYNKKIGRSVTDEKLLYYGACAFRFDLYSIKEIPGYEKLLSLGIYHPLKNPKGVCRDHLVSKSYGWRNKVDPSIISHPCNCQFITNEENIRKNDKSAITLEELKDQISTNSFNPVRNLELALSKSKEHREKISATNKKFMNVTDGTVNLRILKTASVPDGFRRGMTKRPYYNRK